MCLAIPGEVLEISGEDALERMATVRFGSVQREVSLAFVPKVAIGDYVLVHVGMAIARIDPDEANRTLDLFRELDGEAV